MTKTKKQKNKKEAKQNFRNRIANRRYKSIGRSLIKSLYSKISKLNTVEHIADSELKINLAHLANKIYCSYDKSVKKGTIHKNAAARKKSKIQLMLNSSLFDRFVPLN